MISRCDFLSPLSAVNGYRHGWLTCKNISSKPQKKLWYMTSARYPSSVFLDLSLASLKLEVEARVIKSESINATSSGVINNPARIYRLFKNLQKRGTPTERGGKITSRAKRSLMGLAREESSQCWTENFRHPSVFALSSQVSRCPFFFPGVSLRESIISPYQLFISWMQICWWDLTGWRFPFLSSSWNESEIGNNWTYFELWFSIVEFRMLCWKLKWPDSLR